MADNKSEASSVSGVSDSSSVREAHVNLKKRQAGRDGEQDLLEQKKSLQEGIFACMYTLAREKLIDSWKLSVIKILMEGLTGFIISFNPTVEGWDIDVENWFWKIVRWVVWRSPIARIWGYDTYIKVFYVQVVIIYILLLLVALLTIALRRAEQSKTLKKIAKWLQFGTDIVFAVCYMTIFDYLVSTLNCGWTSKPIMHNYFTDVVCVSGGHLIHMVVGAITALFFFCATAAILTASCDLNPVAKGMLASPAAVARLKVLFGKAVYIIAIDCLGSIRKLQVILAFASSVLIWWWNFRNVPFLKLWVNCVWSPLWLGISYSTGMLLALEFTKSHDPNFNQKMTMNVLYGIFPVILGGAGVQWLYIWYKERYAEKFLNVPIDMKLKKVHNFESKEDVELISRAMRKFDIEGKILEEAALIGDRIIKAGMQLYPNDPFLLILYANFLMEVRHDGPASRTQLQIAAKNNPSTIQKFQIFATIENSKRLKDSQDGQLDLQAYVEFKRNYRAVMRVHKEAIQSQREFWKMLMHSHAKMASIHHKLHEVDHQMDRAQQVYRRVMERYPSNGKLIKCYGRFLENVKNDMSGAARYYNEANRMGGHGDMLMAMDFDFTGQGKPEFLTTMDLHEDAVIIIDATGNIMMVSQNVTDMFGYPKSELEGANVAMLMPQPFSGRHASYLQRYTTTGDPHILDSVREVVALHSDRYVFPVELCVTKLSGVGADCIFLGLIRPVAVSATNVRVWISPAGMVLCCDQAFSSLVGVNSEELVGRSFASLVTDQHAAELLLQSCMTVPASDFDEGKVTAEVKVVHKYLHSVPVNIKVKLAGTDQQRIFVMNMQRTDGKDEGLIVCDTRGSISFASYDVAVILGHSTQSLLKMKIDQLIPAPYNVMHSKWLHDFPPSWPTTSCRSGTVVHLQSISNVPVPVRLTITQTDDATGTKHVVRVQKAGPEDFADTRRIHLTINGEGKIQQVGPANSTVFGWNVNSLQGQHVSEIIDVFGEWKERTGSDDMNLMLLALIDHEQELPGSSWRVQVKPPPELLKAAEANAGKGHVALSEVMHGRTKDAKNLQARAAVLLTEKIESEEGLTVKLHLWRRDLLTGAVELDKRLHIRKADHVMGLVVGVPAASLLKQPLYRFLNFPKGQSWEQVMEVKAKTGALKSTVRGVLSQPRAFEGPHPDGGTMRLIIQGVPMTDGLGAGKTRIEATLHPDTTFKGARANLFVALGLEVAKGGAHDGSSRSGDSSSDDDGRSRAAAEREGLQLTHQELKAAAAALMDAEEPDEAAHEMKVDSDGDDDREKEGGGKPSEFVARWVRTVSNQMGDGGNGTSKPEQPDLAAIDEEEEEGGVKGKRQQRTDADIEALAAAMPDEAMVEPQGRKHHHHRSASGDGPGGNSGNTAGEDDASESSGGDTRDDDARSAVSATNSQVDEILVDSRRGRVVKKLTRLLVNPMFTKIVQRLWFHTFAVMFLMLATHVVCYVVFESLVKEQHVEVFRVHKQALAADRSKVLTVKTQLAYYCSKIALERNESKAYNITNVCSQLTNIPKFKEGFTSTILDLADYHQGVYLGFGKVKKLTGKNETSLWNIPSLNSTIYENTNPPNIYSSKTSLFPFGNRYVINGYTLLWVISNAPLKFNATRSYYYIIDNSDAIFNAYTTSLDYLMATAWSQLDRLKVSLLVLLVIEALIVQMLLAGYQLWLVRRVERMRQINMLIMLGLPGPILRTLHSRPIHVLDDDSDDGEDEDEEGGDGRPAAAAANTAANKAGDADAEGRKRRMSNAAPVGPAVAHQDSAASGDDRPANDWPRLTEGDGNRRRSMDARPVDPAMVIAAMQGHDILLDEEPASGAKFHIRTKSKKGGGDVSLTRGALSFNGKTVVPSYSKTVLLMLPLALWWCGLMAIYIISYVRLQGMQDPLAALNMATHVIYRYTSVRSTAFLLVSQETDAGKDKYKAQLRQEVDWLKSEYNTLLYGGMAVTQVGAAFTSETPAAAFVDAQFSDNFFKSKKCFRWDQATCIKDPTGAEKNPDPGLDQYYEVSRNGLDTMMRRAFTELDLLISDNNTEVNYASTRYDYMFNVGVKDLYEGLQTSAQLFVDYSIKRYGQVTLLHTILLVVTVVCAVLYVWFIIRPHVRKVKLEAVRVAGLLSHVPQEMDVASHTRHVLRMHGMAAVTAKK